VIYALRHPAVLLGLLLGFVLGVVLRVAVQRRIVRAGVVGARRLRPVGGRLRASAVAPRAGWAAYLDPYGVVAAVLSGVGWGVRPEGRRRGAGTDAALVAAAVAVHAALAAAGFAAFHAAGGVLATLHDVDVSQILHGSVAPPDTGQAVALGFGMVNLACGLLALLPLPPLELGVALWSRLPRSPGARRLAYRLLEEQWSVLAVLLLLLLPIAGEKPVLLAVIDAVGGAVTGAF
jgi:hypothetical protein